MPSEGVRGEEVVDVTDGNYRRYAITSGFEFVRKIFTLLSQAKEGVVTLRVTLSRTLALLWTMLHPRHSPSNWARVDIN